MASAGDEFSILNRGKNKPQEKAPEIKRYRAGQVPEFYQDDDNDDDIFPGQNDIESVVGSITTERQNKRFELLYKSTTSTSETIQAPNIRPIKKTLLIESFDEIEPVKNDQDFINEQKQQEDQKAELTTVMIKSDNVEQKESRASLRARLLKQQQEQETKINEEQHNIEFIENRNNLKKNLEDLEENLENDFDQKLENEEDYDGFEDDQYNEGLQHGQGNFEKETGERGILNILKPVYVSKQVRDTKDQILEEEMALMEEKKKNEKRLKEETRMLVIQAVRQNDQEKDEDNTSQNGEEMPDDNDNFDEANEYQLWKIRELKRIQLERQMRNKIEADKAEIQRRRNLTDEQRFLENKKLGSDSTQVKEKVKYRFMQKFYKQGAFFQDSDDPIFQRDYNTAVGEDAWDKSALPSVLQKRRGEFGKRGQSKYTHLTDQDTTNFDPYFKKDADIENKVRQKFGGYKGQDILDRQQLKKMKI